MTITKERTINVIKGKFIFNFVVAWCFLYFIPPLVGETSWKEITPFNVALWLAILIGITSEFSGIAIKDIYRKIRNRFSTTEDTLLTGLYLLVFLYGYLVIRGLFV